MTTPHPAAAERSASIDVEALAKSVSKSALKELQAIAETRLVLGRPTSLMVFHRLEGATSELEPAGLVRWGKAKGFGPSFGSVEPTEKGWALVGALPLLERLRAAEAVCEVAWNIEFEEGALAANQDELIAKLDVWRKARHTRPEAAPDAR